MKTTVLAAVAIITLAGASVASAEERGAAGGAVGGAAAGAVGGAIIGGPVGAAAGAVIGGAAGAVAGGLSTNDRTYVQTYVVKRPADNVVVDGNVAVGVTLPPKVRYHTFSGNERLRAYRYAQVNDRYVVVDSSGRVVEVIN